MGTVIIVHGGAGVWDTSSDKTKQAVADCVAAATMGQDVLLDGRSALDAVEQAVRILEDSPVLDAGRGSYLNTAGQIQMDALIMDGANLDLGAIAAVERIRNPISLARRVMTDSVHSFLVADGAGAFADAIGFPRCDTADLIYPPDMEEYLSNLDNSSASLTGTNLDSGPHGDTVGAAALDATGNLAAATSTGGTRRKQPGRVGDSPLTGSGAYADNWTGAVSATGRGESLMKVLISKRVCDFVASGLSAQKACEAAIAVLEERVNGYGGMIAVDARGQVGLSFNTEAMPYAYAFDDQAIVKGR